MVFYWGIPVAIFIVFISPLVKLFRFAGWIVLMLGATVEKKSEGQGTPELHEVVMVLVVVRK